MATGFSFEVQGLDKLLKLFHELPERTQREMEDELKVTSWEIRDGAKRDAPTDESRIRQSISSKETGQLSFEVVAQSFYAGYLEFGTKTKVSVPAGLESIASQLKGPVSGQGNPIDALREWVKRKRLAGVYSIKTRKQSKSKKSLANIEQTTFIIWRHIKKYGIRPQPFFFKQMEPAEKRLRQRLANIIKSLIE